jgi:hypothetical protein
VKNQIFKCIVSPQRREEERGRGGREEKREINKKISLEFFYLLSPHFHLAFHHLSPQNKTARNKRNKGIKGRECRGNCARCFGYPT